MTVIDELLGNAEAYSASFDKGDLPLPPAKRVAILACMDARLNPYGAARPQRGRRARDPQRRRRHHRRRDPIARDLAAAARDRGDHADPSHRLRDADLHATTISDGQMQEDMGIKPEWAAEASRPGGRCPPVDRADQGEPVHPEEGAGSRLRLRGRERTTARGALEPSGTGSGGGGLSRACTAPPSLHPAAALAWACGGAAPARSR